MFGDLREGIARRDFVGVLEGSRPAPLLVEQYLRSAYHVLGVCPPLWEEGCSGAGVHGDSSICRITTSRYWTTIVDAWHFTRALAGNWPFGWCALADWRYSGFGCGVDPIDVAQLWMEDWPCFSSFGTCEVQ